MGAGREDWVEANQSDLMGAVARVHSALERAAKGGSAGADRDSGNEPSPWSALQMLSSALGLSRFERDVLLMCAGMELDGRFAGVFGPAPGGAGYPYPTFGCALAALSEPHWSAIAPSAPLRHWHLIEWERTSGGGLLTSRLRIDERVLHFLTGMECLDERLAGVIELAAPEHLVHSHQSLAEAIAAAWTPGQFTGRAPMVQICGADAATRRAIVAGAGAIRSMRLFTLAAERIPIGATESETFQRLLERELILSNAALCVELDDVDRQDPRTMAHLSKFLESVARPVAIASQLRWRPLCRGSLFIEARKPTADEQRGVWRELLADTPLASAKDRLEELTSNFNMTVAAMQACVQEALLPGEREPPIARLKHACRSQARLRLDDLAQRIEPCADWDDLVLPDGDKQALRQIAAQVDQRATVYEAWGFGEKVNRGLGVSALFAGPSGCGKTMAAEVLAASLKLDLYRIDLAGAVSKYIGETEKNLRRIFDAAEDSGAILLFDEADALFGKRSEVKDSHDRYANIEVSYLLQRMEAYRGLALLATNLKGSVDSAFLRRLRFVINFPFPEVPQRLEIWRRIFPPRTPTDGLNLGALARLNITGGSIRNIAMNAAFLAAHASEPVRMNHILQAARAEYGKLERPLTDLGPTW